MIEIIVSEEIRQRCPEFVGAAVFASVHATPSRADLWEEIDRFLPVPCHLGMDPLIV